MSKNYNLYKVGQFSDFKEMLDMAAEKHQDTPAFRFRENKEIRDVSYKEFRETCNALGTALASLGIHGKHIAMVSENSYFWVTAYLTVLGSDNVFIPADKELPFNELLHVLTHSEADVVFFSAQFEELFRENQDKLPNVRYFVCNKPVGLTDDKFLNGMELIEKGRQLLADGNTDYTSIKPADYELGMLVYTSGTTGVAKGVMLSRHNLRSAVYCGMQISRVYTTSLSVLPYNHTYEAVCDLLVSLHNGSTICINENLRTVADNLKRYKPDYIMLVPLFVENFYKKIWKNLEKNGQADKVRKAIKMSNALRKVGIDLRPRLFKQILDVFGGKMIKIVCGGAPIRPELAEFFDGIGISLINGYGITECSPLVAVNRDYYNNFRSVGVVMPCCQVRIDQPNEDGEGEIMVKGDVIMMGYYKNPEATAAALSPEGWFATGDYGKMIGDQLFITGRKKNLIVLKNGKNVYPEEIEDYIMAIDEVEEVVVRSIRDDNNDEIGLLAEIFPERNFAEDRTEEEIKQYLEEKLAKINQTLPGYKQVQTIKLRNTEFPKTTSRKIKRQG